MENFLQLEKQLCFAVYEASSEFNKLYASVLQEFGLTYPQYLVLLALWEKEAITLKELGERLTLGTGTLTPMVNRMVENGWLRKERSTEDERKVHIYLLDKANQEKAAITSKVADTIQSCQIELDEYQQLMHLLHELKTKLKRRD